ncbi:zinc metalloproteinase nas-13-like [Phymastichus coffea]|uniref:zinc metalloproteinase nas-13-like n=1 Tax=Phymastichus coffea TaxID=108790 RepID=UPI00273ACF2F|nr:zinc metalloproteinase nas-13-like [Phymastichus coffea]
MFHLAQFIVLFCSTYVLVSGLSLDRSKIKDVPPSPKHVGIFDDEHDRKKIEEKMNKWKPEDDNYIWELSGLYEGDMMGISKVGKNGILDVAKRWPDAVIPYHIEEDDFSEVQIEKIEKALKVYHEKTCVRFRPYKKGDKDFIIVKGDSTGCWSYVGKHGEGQVVNFQNPGCLRPGTIIHEFMHALGFYHQQSAADRDDWITIVWDNITPGREHNFDKYDNKTVSDYGVTYDYGSVMHYSAKAFSKNGNFTILCKKENVTLGQRDGFSEKDIKKVDAMYEKQCKARDKKEKGNSTILENIISSIWPFEGWFGVA